MSAEVRAHTGQLREVLIEGGGLPSCPDQVFRLDLACAHLAILGALLDVLDKFLLLVLELHALAVELALGFLQSSLVLAEAFLGGHASAEGPLHDLW